MEIATALSGTAPQSQADTARISVADTFDNFLKLLTTQLQHQDPLEPMDSTEFTQQLVQFTNVEQNIATNKNLEQLVALMQSGQAASAVGYLGNIVEMRGSETHLDDGQATWRYELPGPAESVTLAITDATGRLVWTGAGQQSLGSHDFVWDGNDNAGNPLPEGSYALSITATNTADTVLAPMYGPEAKSPGSSSMMVKRNFWSAMWPSRPPTSANCNCRIPRRDTKIMMIVTTHPIAARPRRQKTVPSRPTIWRKLP